MEESSRIIQLTTASLSLSEANGSCAKAFQGLMQERSQGPEGRPTFPLKDTSIGCRSDSDGPTTC